MSFVLEMIAKCQERLMTFIVNFGRILYIHAEISVILRIHKWIKISILNRILISQIQREVLVIIAESAGYAVG